MFLFYLCYFSKMRIIYFLHVVSFMLHINYAILHRADFLLEILIFTRLFKEFSTF